MYEQALGRLDARVQRLQAELEDRTDQLQRLQADYEFKMSQPQPAYSSGGVDKTMVDQLDSRLVRMQCDLECRLDQVSQFQAEVEYKLSQIPLVPFSNGPVDKVDPNWIQNINS